MERDRVGKGWTVDGIIPAHGDVECDVQVGLVAARVELYVSLRRHSQDVPLNWKKWWFKKIYCTNVPRRLFIPALQ
jgi:hypothetical protein